MSPWCPATNLKVPLLELVCSRDVQLPDQPDKGRPGVARQPADKEEWQLTGDFKLNFLKGSSHEIGEACIQFYWIDYRFSLFPRQVIFYFRRRFHIEFLKTTSSAELQLSIALQMTNIAPGTKTVLRKAKKSCRECSPEFPGKLSPQISIFNFLFFQLKR